MARPRSFPIRFDHALQIHISDLRNWGYLIPSVTKKGALAWSVSGKQIGSISISTNSCSEYAFLDLSFKYVGEYRTYSIGLVTLPSNLWKGRVWYFICPVTGKRCRILYMVAGYFLHRDAFPGCMYECQIKSKKDQTFEKEIGWCLVMDRLYDQLYARNFKSCYAGKPTKRYNRIMNKFHNVFPDENPRYGTAKFSENYIQKPFQQLSRLFAHKSPANYRNGKWRDSPFSFIQHYFSFLEYQGLKLLPLFIVNFQIVFGLTKANFGEN